MYMKKLISILLLVVCLFSAAFAEYVPLEKGSKGDTVKELQQRLIDLGYLSDKADGSYGNKTKTAVEMFQREAGIAANGIADESTQEALFAEDAPKAKVYQKMDYKEFARNPDAHEDELVTFSGKVVQVCGEEEYEGGTLVQLRVATRKWDDVVYVYYTRKDGEARILEDDKVVVYGSSKGLLSYQSTGAGTITIPVVNADSVALQ